MMFIYRDGRRKLPVVTALLLVAAFLPAMLWAQSQENISLNFKDTDIRQVIGVIAEQSGTNIIAEKSVRGNVTVSLKDVYYEEAMNLIAKTNGFAVRRIGNTWILATEKNLVDAFEKGLSMTKRLQYAKPSDVSKIITATIKKDVNVAVDDRINGVVISGGKDILAEVEKLIETLDVPVHQVMIEAKIVKVETNATKRLGVNWKAGVTAPGEGTFDLLSGTEFFAKNPNSQLYDPAASGVGKIFGLGDFYRAPLKYSATINALESRSESKTLSNPKISAINGEEAYINVGDVITYGGTADQPPKEKDTGVKLKVRPMINDDGYVTVYAEPEVSTSRTEGSYDYPIISTSAAKTSVRVKDGEEILIGGMIQDNESTSSMKIPLLGDIPIIKSLFRNTDRRTNSQELIFLLVPHIIAQSLEPVSTGFADMGGPLQAPMSSYQPSMMPMGSIDDSFDNAFDTSF